MNKKLFFYYFGIFFLILFFMTTAAYAQNNYFILLAETPDKNILDANISSAEKDILEELAALEEETARMEQLGLSVTRISDGMIIAQDQYRREKEFLDAGRKPNFSGTQRQVDEMTQIIELAFEAKDEIDALQKFSKEAEAEIDVAPVKEILKKALNELQNERYERAIELAKEGQEKIVELQSIDTKAKAAAEAAAANITTFLDTNKFNIIAAIVGIGSFYFVLRNRIKYYLTRARMHSLELERETLKKEIQRAQDEFFLKGTLPERVYNIRVKVFSHMIREITRKVAVLSEAERKASFFKVSNLLAKKEKEVEKEIIIPKKEEMPEKNMVIPEKKAMMPKKENKKNKNTTKPLPTGGRNKWQKK